MKAQSLDSLHSRIGKLHYNNLGGLNGARTRDLWRDRPVLCPSELSVQNSHYRKYRKAADIFCSGAPEERLHYDHKSGQPGGTRTRHIQSESLLTLPNVDRLIALLNLAACKGVEPSAFPWTGGCSTDELTGLVLQKLASGTRLELARSGVKAQSLDSLHSRTRNFVWPIPLDCGADARILALHAVAGWAGGLWEGFWKSLCGFRQPPGGERPG